MPLDLTDKSTLVQVMAWCLQATRDYLSQCWPRSMSPNGVTRPQWVNTLRPKQNVCHFADNNFNCIFLNENVWSSIKIPLKFVPKVIINNISELVQIVAWCWQGDKPLSEAMMVSLLPHICITRPHWVNLVCHIPPLQVSYLRQGHPRWRWIPLSVAAVLSPMQPAVVRSYSVHSNLTPGRKNRNY